MAKSKLTESRLFLFRRTRSVKPIVEPEPFPSERVAKAAVPAVEIEDEKALDDELASTETT